MVLTLEERVAVIETELEKLKARDSANVDDKELPWWEQIRGTFKDDPHYEEAMRLGREWRESFRPTDTEAD